MLGVLLRQEVFVLCQDPWMETQLRRADLDRLLGPVADWSLGAVETLVETQCDGYLLRHVAYEVPSGRASVLVCIPDGLERPAPLVYCHHQHAGRFDLGKSEVVGLRGDPDQAYAAELARRGFVTVTADVIGFEDRNWSGDQNISWFELSSRLVRGRTLLADELQEISLAIDHGLSLPQVAPQAVGFLGHSFGGRMALWAPAWDCRIRASVSNCGCISYRESVARDAAFRPTPSCPASREISTSRTWWTMRKAATSWLSRPRRTAGAGVRQTSPRPPSAGCATSKSFCALAATLSRRRTGSVPTPSWPAR